MDNVWAIVLAAGSSRRMKRQKLLLPFNGKTIIETVIENIKSILNSNILVVLGSHYYEINEQISKLPVRICLNDNYREGMLSSVICGFRELPEEVEAALIFLGDQPQIPPAVSEMVLLAWAKSEKSIVIPVYKGKRGHPVLIETKYKPVIESLDPGNGLRQLMSDFPLEILEVECHRPEILRDIDTPVDYSNEVSKRNK